MPRFDLDSYEPVEERIKKFYAMHPEGSILTELHEHSDDFVKVVFMAVVFDGEGSPIATGWAMEEQGKGMVNGTSHVENCETSAIGRALANMGLHGNKRPSREEMQKVDRAEAKPSSEEEKVAGDMKQALDAMKSKGVDAQVIEGYRTDATQLWKEKKLGALAELVAKMKQECDLELF